MEGLPDDVITNIMDTVPKKQLLGFRCLSTRWCRLIDDRLFRKSLLYLFPMFSSSVYCIDLRRPDDLVKIENPLGWEQIVLLGSCRNILCIYNEDDGQIAIWSPSTRWYKLLPFADGEIAHRLGPPAYVYGFGYDDMSEECVLLRLFQSLEDPVVSAVSIYRSRANVWRRLQGIPPYSLVDPHTMGVFLHDHLYWMMICDSAIVLVAFDIHTGNSTKVHQRNFIDNRLRMNLAVLGGSLCLIFYGERGDVNVFIRNERWGTSRYGSEESWDSLFSIPDHDGVLLQPLAYSPNGHRVLLLDRWTLFWYNLHTNEVEQFHITPMLGYLQAAATCFFVDSHPKLSVTVCLFGVNPPRLYYISPLMDAVGIEFPHSWQDIRLLGSCRHLLCIYNVDDCRIAIWNPASGSCRLLPPPDAEIPHGFGVSGEIPHILDLSAGGYGFGYDDWNNEYVLLTLVQSFEESIVSAVSIYRSGDNAWRQLQGILPYSLAGPDLHRRGFFLRGCLHWLMRGELVQDLAKVLVAFDIHTESFVEVGLPNFIDNRREMDLAVLGCSLCLVIYGEQMGVNVWIMIEDGLNESWDRLFSIPDCPSHDRPVQPLSYSQNGHQVLVGMNKKTLVWYDLRTNDVEVIHVEGKPGIFKEATFLRLNETPR